MFKIDRIKIISFVLLICINGLAFLLYRHLFNNTQSEKAQLLEYSNEIGNEITDSLNNELAKTEYIVDSIALLLKDSIFNNQELSSDTNIIKGILQNILEKRSHLDGAYIAFEKAKDIGYPKDVLSIYTRRVDDNFVTSDVSNSYNYVTDTIKGIWFNIPKCRNKPTWVAPFFGSAGKKKYAAYVVPIRLPNSSTCILGITYTSMDLYFLLNSWKTSRVGYPYLMNRKCEFIAHPNNETRTLKEIGIGDDQPELVQLANNIESEDSISNVAYYHRNTISKAMCWEKIFHIKQVDWFLGISVADQQVYSNPNFFNQQRKRLILCSFIFFFLLMLAELVVIKKMLVKETHSLQISSFAISLFLLTEILLIYHYYLKYPIVEFTDIELKNLTDIRSKIIENENTDRKKNMDLTGKFDRWNFSMLLDNEGVHDYISLYNIGFRNKRESQITEVPTGIYIQTLRFSDSYSTEVTGYAWQILKNNSNTKPGILFPDAENALIVLDDTKHIFLDNGEKAISYRWHFSIEIRESFNYRLYPFDRNDLWLRLWHISFDQDIILVPDFDSYMLFHPSFKPGLDNDVIFPGWEIEGSYYSYKGKNYNSNFGQNRYFTKESFPELHYNIMLKREYLDPIITRIIPLMVLLFMIYSILYIARKKDALNVAVACSGLLFVAVFEQVNLRRGLDVSGIIYMEYYYFTTYILLMLVSVNVIVNERLERLMPGKIDFTQVTKTIYWPFALFLILIATIFTFY